MGNWEDYTKEMPLTYRQIKKWADSQGWDFSPGGYDTKVLLADLLPGDPDSMPWGVLGWLMGEVMPSVKANGSYEWPEDLDALQLQRKTPEGLTVTSRESMQLAGLPRPSRLWRPGPPA